MPDSTISGLPSASALSGTEMVPIVQNGNTVKATTQQIFNGATIGTPVASAVVYTPPGTGAVATTVGAKLSETVSIKDFGAVCDGVTDDTAAINLAIASGAKSIFVPANTLISSALAFTSGGVTFYGASQSTTITQATTSAGIISNSGGYNTFKSLRLGYSGTPIAGATAIYSTGVNTIIDSVNVLSCYNGFEFTGGAAQMARNFQIANYVNIGLYAHSINDLLCRDFIINAGNATNGALGGIRLQDKVEAAVFETGDVLNGVFSLTTDASSYAPNARPAYNRFTNVYFDSAAQGSSINNSVVFDFSGSWFSGGRTGAGYPGLTIGVADTIKFRGTDFFNCGSHGCVANNTSAARLSWIDCDFESNCQTAASGTSDGLHMVSGVSNWSVIGGTARNGLYPGGQQGSGIYVGAACTNFSIRDVDTGSNIAAGISDNSAIALTSNKTISGCLNYRTQSNGRASIVNPATTAVVTHGLGTPGIGLTPDIGDIMIAYESGPAGSAGPQITAWNGTTFTIGFVTPPAGTTYVNWQVRTAGA